MKRRIRIGFTVLLAGITIGVLQAADEPVEPPTYHPAVQVFFTPPHIPAPATFPPVNCADALREEIAAATSSIYVQADYFNLTDIATALDQGKRRGVIVELILGDRNLNATASPWPMLWNDKVNV